MNHSKNYEKIKEYYDSGLWGIERVREAVVKGKITAAEFEEITGVPYASSNK